MSEVLLYQRILGLTPPWKVTSVNLDESLNSLVVEVDYEKGHGHICPKCGHAAVIHDSRLRRWRHLDTCQYQTVISAKVPRIRCPNHHCTTLSVPWADESSRYTELFENRVIQFLKIASIQAVSKLFNLSWGAVDRIMQKAVSRGLSIRSDVSTEYLLIDETSFRKGRNYVAVLSNHNGQVLAVADGCSHESVKDCASQLPENALDKTKTVCMDMSPAFVKGVSMLIPDARKKIAFDHYHVAQLLTKAVESIRKSEASKLLVNQRREAYNLRYCWLRNRQKLSEEHKEKLAPYVKSLKDTALAWYFKEWARDIWKRYKVKGARKNWEHWLELVDVTNLTPLKTAASTIRDKLWGILNAMKFETSNAKAEATNGKIRQLKVRAMGYRNKERFKTAILFHYGNLELNHQIR